MLALRTTTAGVLWWLAVGMSQGQVEKPAALLAAEEARTTAIATGIIDWSIERSSLRSGQFARTKYYSSAYAASDEAVADLGDENGVTAYNSDGSPSSQYSYNGPRSLLFLDGTVWSHTERAPFADQYDPENAAVHSRPPAVRWAGFSPVLRSPGLPHPDAGHEVEYSASREGHLHVVTATSGDTCAKLWIDPGRGWNVTRAQLSQGGRTLAESRSALREFGSVWFPESVAYSEARPDGSLELIEVVHVHSAEFNSPQHPQSLRPADIGVEPGTAVTTHNPATAVGHGYWTGEAVVSFDEFRTRLERGELAYGPTVARELGLTPAAPAKDRGESASQSGAAPPDGAVAKRDVADARVSAWREYTREYVAKFRLTEEQSQKAWQICGNMETEAIQYVRRRAAELSRIERRLAENPASESARRERDHAIAPLDAMFDRLKYRLDRLPTRDQRERAPKQG